MFAEPQYLSILCMSPSFVPISHRKISQLAQLQEKYWVISIVTAMQMSIIGSLPGLNLGINCDLARTSLYGMQ